MLDASVLAQQAQFRLLLGDLGLVLRPQTRDVSREDEGVAVQAAAVLVEQSARVMDGVVVVVCVDDPVVVIWKAKTGGQGHCERSHDPRTQS